MKRQILNRLAVSLSLCLALAVAAASAPLAQAATSAADVDLSGFWTMTADSRRVPPAKLLPTVTKSALAEHAKNDAYAIRWCDLVGLPYMMDPSMPINLRQGQREIALYADIPSSVRHIYLDRKQHVDPDDWDASTVGDSIGHWEGSALVVDTVGFAGDRGITSIPGGGFRTGTSHLVERFQLLEHGTVLSVTSTWTDPKVFVSPHSYEYRYYLLPKAYEPVPKQSCDAYDKERAKFLEEK